MGDQERVGRRKPTKLVEPVTRDSLAAWDLNMRAYFRQNNQGRFLPNAPNGIVEWPATQDDPQHGLPPVMQAAPNAADVDDAATQAQFDKFEDFLTTLGTYCPDYFLDTVWRESTSYLWVIAKIRDP